MIFNLSTLDFSLCLKMPNCVSCSSTFADTKTLREHLKLQHSLHNLQTYTCREKGCSRDFTSWKTFRKHLIELHNCKAIASTNFSPVNQNVSNEFFEKTDDRITRDAAEPNLVFDAFEDEHVSSTLDKLRMNVKTLLVDFCLKKSADPRQPRINVQKSLEDCRDIAKAIFEEIMVVLTSEFHQDEELAIIKKVRNSFDVAFKPFEDVSSEYKRFKIFKTLGYIEPQSYIIGSTFDPKYKDGQMSKENVPKCGQFIPMRRTLEQFLNLPNVLESILEYMKELYNNDEVLSNFIQGKIWKEKVLLHFVNKIVIPIILYYDDFDTNNALGAHKTIQKLGSVMFFIPCLPPQFRSQLENIFLALLFHSSDRSLFGNESTFKPIIDEINYLQQNGIKFTINGREETVYFALGVLTGDNLGLNSALGMAESFSANYYCRRCKMKKTRCYHEVEEVQFFLRKVDDYDSDVLGGLEKTGVKEKSVWNQIDHFHVYENFYFDTFHDFHEGVIPDSLNKVLDYFIRSKQLSLNILNDRIRTFNYTINGVHNKPLVFKENELKTQSTLFTGSESLNLALTLPMLIGDLIDPDDKVWQYFLKLREIMDLVLAKNLQKECCKLIPGLVADHLSLYKQAFERTLFCKYHNELHYGIAIEECGPIDLLSTIRPEGNNKFLKTIADATDSRQNITLTIAIKNQLNLLLRVVSGDGFSDRIEKGKAKELSKTTVEVLLSDFLRSGGNLQYEDGLSALSWVKLSGIKYSVGTTVVLDFDDEMSVFVFGRILNIFSDKSDQFSFYCQVLQVRKFEEKLHAYEVEISMEKVLIKSVKEFFSPQPVIFHQMENGKFYVTLRYAL